MLKKVYITRLVIIAALVLFINEKAFGQSGLSFSCSYSWGENLEYVNGGGSPCDKHILYFSVENEIIPQGLEPDSFFDLYFPDLFFFLLMPCFSDEELMEIRDENLFNDFVLKINVYEIVHLKMPSYSAESKSGKELTDLLFTPADDHIILENPRTGEDMYLSGIDYVKFRGAPLIPVPNPAD